MVQTQSDDTIAAIATPPGRGGVGIVRVSGPAVTTIAKSILRQCPPPRQAVFTAFLDDTGQALDEGIALYFKAPHSFTGEDVLELQGHGGPVVLDLVLKRVCQAGARLARPGEFSERAFLNDKLDVVQAEAIADLIEAESEQAARSAVRSLQGEFSATIHALVDRLIELRMYVEAAIDFPEEEVDFLADQQVFECLDAVEAALDRVRASARQGQLLKDGMTVVIAGRPNAGKSSLLNALAGRETAIVTDIEGTTRDILREHIHLDGMPLHIIDTAGLRETEDRVEQIGIERAWQAIAEADRILFLTDASRDASTDPRDVWPELYDRLTRHDHITLIRNKIDLTGESPGLTAGEPPVIRLSAASGEGLDALRAHLKSEMGFVQVTESSVIARTRHLEALERAAEHLGQARQQLEQFLAGELMAEELRLAQQALSEITGAFTADDLLGRIFSSFCIGK
ncbi:MAG: tRNA uridine-5-carboxymethylaminomethyl(34) synthesis GTPase MnmE [Gammaproteobacteria bacterium]|nr:MAG: tRNA uridine-5-carboxymethylaminomethyl(34) synthesis GTPase MnmE [Gammaproteobacteria bacterium]